MGVSERHAPPIGITKPRSRAVLNPELLENRPRPFAFGYIARTKVKLVVNKKRELVRVPLFLHRMSIYTQRRWSERNRVEFIVSTSKTTARQTHVRCIGTS